MQDPVRIFAIYEKRDEPLFQELSKHLAVLRRLKVIEMTSAMTQLGGDITNDQIAGLAEQDMLLLLVSDHLLASDEAFEQVEKAMELQKSQGIRVVPLLIRPVDTKGLPMGSLVALPRNGRPVSEWAQRDSAWFEIAQGIRQVAEAIQAKERPARRAAQTSSAGPSPATPSAGPSPTTPSAGPSPTTPNRFSLRKLLNAVLVGDVDLENFSGDFFPEVRARFTRGMERGEKVTLLLDHAPHAQIFHHLQLLDPAALEKHKDLISFD